MSHLPRIVSDNEGFVLRLSPKATTLISYDPATCIRLSMKQMEKLFNDTERLLENAKAQGQGTDHEDKG